MRRTFFALGSLVVVASASCGGGSGAAGEAVAPDEQTAQDALGIEEVECGAEPSYAEPLVVDLSSNDRLDLEVAMKDGVALVSYDCKELKIVKGCTLPGGYEFAGVSRKEQVVQMKSSDELAANLPLSVAKLSAEMQRGRSIDLAMVMVGKRSAPSNEATREELEGSCEGVTHFVRAATLGAFSMATGTKGKVAAVAELFGAGTNAASASERSNMNKDGSLDSCRESKPDAETPPGECQSAIRLELVPFVAARSKDKKGGKGGKGEKEVQAAKNPCPPGFSFAGGICTKDAEAPRLCDPKSEADCKAQCDKGHAQSCANLGVLMKKAKQPRAAYLAVFKKACEGGAGDGCSPYGWSVYPDETKNDPGLKKTKAALAIHKRGCDLGSAESCDDVGTVIEDDAFGVENKPMAVEYYRRGCSLGFAMSCWSLAYKYLKGEGVKKDLVAGLKLLARSCDAGVADDCDDLGNIIFQGKFGVPKKLDAAYVVRKRGCLLDLAYCDGAGDVAAAMGNYKVAAEHYVRGCDVDNGTWSACLSGAAIFEKGKKGVPKDEGKAKQLWSIACENGDGEDKACAKLGIPMKE